MTQQIPLNEVRDFFYRGPAIVVGPGLTTYPTVQNDCLEKLRRDFPTIQVDSSVHDVYDFAERLAEVVPLERIRSLVATFLGSAKNPQLEKIVRARWTAVISLTGDDHFRSALRTHLDSKPLSWTVTNVAKPGGAIPPRTIPLFQPLGDPLALEPDLRLVVTKSEYLERRRYWRELFRTLPDFVRGDPLVFAGTSAIVDVVVDCLNEMLALGGTVPRRLIFLAEDPAAQNPRLTSLVRGHCDIHIVPCSIVEFCSAIQLENLPHATRVDLEVKAGESFDRTKLFSVEDQLAFVPPDLPLGLPSGDHTHRLLDILFSPTKLDWSPYSAGLDFARDVTKEIEELIEQKLLQPSDEQPYLLVKAEAGVGKTVALRRVAFDLSRKGHLCIWIRRSYGELSGGKFETAVRQIEAAVKGRKTKVIIFYDDPSGGSITGRELFQALANARFRWVTVLGVRNTDFSAQESSDFLATWSRFDSIEIPTTFSKDEAEKLPSYLLRLGITEAEVILRKVQSSAKDILCMLWYLLPQTRAAISASLTDEYLRLASRSGPIGMYADAASEQPGLARHAYELVTTMSGFGTAVPLEVLASALGISIGQWHEMCAEKKPLWGLLYDEPYPTAETFAYRTRNEVVTNVLLSILNGGTFGHAGELRCLTSLVKACSCGNPPYREFLCDLLIRHKRKLEERFTYEQGLELYDLAIRTFPVQDRAIAHHRALWIKDVGKLPELAYRELESVQRVAPYTQSSRGEPLEHVHTSMAASVYQAITKQEIELQAGVELIKQHIAKASSPNWFDSHAAHVHAKTLLKLSTHLRTNDQNGFIECIEEATQIIDRSLMIIEPLADRRADLAEALKMFSDLRSDVFMAYSSTEEAVNNAIDIFDKSKSQRGLALVARILIGRARDREKGALYKKAQDFINLAINRIQGTSLTPVPEIYLCRAELILNWRVFPQKGDISWPQVRDDLIQAQKSPRVSRDPLWTYFLAVAHYHLQDFPQAEGLFATLKSLQLSRIIKAPYRCFLLAQDGTPKTFQGTIKTGAGANRYIDSSELGADILVHRDDFSQQDEATVHFRVAFSMRGPKAVRHLTESLSSIPYD
jgi:hypothetical protein